MAEVSPYATQVNVVIGVDVELQKAGFTDISEVGRGGFGIVYRCVQPSLDRVVAVKVLTTDLDEENLGRFLREGRAMGRLSGHPHIVTVLEVGTTVAGRPYIVMPFFQKDSLETLIRRHGPLEWPEAVGIGVKIAGALDAAHRNGTLHRDVKPGNILLTDYGEPQLTDFGIARIAGGFQTASGVIAGSPAFTAPEVFEGITPSKQSDVYSLGATLFCALTGHAAFERRDGEKVVAQFVRMSQQPIPDLREQGMPSDLAAAIERAMSRKPSDRHPTAAEFGEELRDIKRNLGVEVDDMAMPVDLGVEGRRASSTTSRRGRITGSRTTGSFGNTTSSGPPTASANKYKPTTTTRALVKRARLTDVIRHAGRRRLILVRAPSGYGKSILAAQWKDELTRNGVGVAWLTVDQDDNNVVWFLVHLLEAIQRIRPNFAPSLASVLEQHGDEATRFVLTSLIEETAQSNEQLTLIVDDWQKVTDPDAIAALGFVLENSGEHLQILVTSWTAEGLPLSKLRLSDEFVEIDAEALRFDAQEAQALLNDVGGLDLEGTDVAALTSSTDGWAAGLRLAALSLRGGAETTSLLTGLGGDNEIIGEFLADNVLSGLEPHIAQFILKTSITARTCGSLASAVAGVPRGQALLDEVRLRGLFLQRVDNDPEWYRYHQLFCEFLRRRLERDHPDQVPLVHRAAATWFAEHGNLIDAINHALAAGDPDLAVDLFEKDESTLLEAGKMTTLLEIVKKLPSKLIAHRPAVQIMVAWANILLQRPQPAHAAINRIVPLLTNPAIPEEMRAALRVETNTQRGYADSINDRVDRLDTLVAEVLDNPDGFHARLPVASALQKAFALTYRWEFDEARDVLEWSVPYQEMLGPYAAVLPKCHTGTIARYKLDIYTALEDFRSAHEIAQTIGPQSHPARLSGALLGELLYETGELEEATELLDDGYEVGAEGGSVDYLVARYVAGARVRAANGDLQAATNRLAAGMKTAERLRQPRFAAAINNERIRLGIDLPPAVLTKLKAARDLPQDRGPATMTAELDEDSAVRLLTTGSDDDQDQACARAAAMVEAIDPAVRPSAALRAELLLLETLSKTGRPMDDARLDDVTGRCVELGLTQLLTDAGL